MTILAMTYRMDANARRRPGLRGRGVRFGAALLFVLLLLAGCAGTPSAPSPVSHANVEPTQEPLEYILGDGDLLDITFFREPAAVLDEYRIHVGDGLDVSFTYYPDLDVQLVVPPDGRIAVKIIGHIPVVDLTTRELTQKIQNELAKTHAQPEVVVTLTAFYSSTLEFFAILEKGENKQNKEVVIRSDGKISLPLLEDIRASGRTPTELTREIQARYNRKIADITVSVEVIKEESKKVLVMGEVNRAGMYQLRGRATPVEAIALAEGFSDSANLEEILILRKSESGEPALNLVNVRQSLTDPSLLETFHLKPYDIIYVPKRKIEEMSDALHRIYDFVPPFVSMGFGYSLKIQD